LKRSEPYGTSPSRKKGLITNGETREGKRGTVRSSVDKPTKDRREREKGTSLPAGRSLIIRQRSFRQRLKGREKKGVGPKETKGKKRCNGIDSMRCVKKKEEIAKQGREGPRYLEIGKGKGSHRERKSLSRIIRHTKSR